MATFEVEFTTPLNVILNIDAADDFEAGEIGWGIVNTFLQTLGTQTGDARIVSVEASIDGHGADVVKELGSDG